MQPLKDTTGRHGVGGGSGGGVEMTMSLSGPPGFSHHTTVPSDSLHQYMNRPQLQQQQQQQHNHHVSKPSLLQQQQHQQQQQQQIPQQALNIHDHHRGSIDPARSGGHDNRPGNVSHRPLIHDIQHAGQDIRPGVHDFRGSSGLDPRAAGGHESSRLGGEVNHRRVDGGPDPPRTYSHRETELHPAIDPRLLHSGPLPPASREYQKGSIESGLPRQHQHQQQHHHHRSNSPSPSSIRRGSLEPKEPPMPPSSRYNSHIARSGSGGGNRADIHGHSHPGGYNMEPRNMGPGPLDANKHAPPGSFESMRSSGRGMDSNTSLMLEMRGGPGHAPLPSPTSTLRGASVDGRLTSHQAGRESLKTAYDNLMPGVYNPHMPSQPNPHLQGGKLPPASAMAGPHNPQLQGVRGVPSASSANPPAPYNMKPSSYSRAPSGSGHGLVEPHTNPQAYHHEAPHSKQQGVFHHGPESQRVYLPPSSTAAAGNAAERTNNLQRIEPGMVGKPFAVESQYPGYAGMPSYHLHREAARDHPGNMALGSARDSTRSYGPPSSVSTSQSSSSLSSSSMSLSRSIPKSSADPHQLSSSSHRHRSPSEEVRRSQHGLIDEPQSHFQHKPTPLGPPHMNTNLHMQSNKHPSQIKDSPYPHAMPPSGTDQLVLRSGDGRGGGEAIPGHTAFPHHPANVPLHSSTPHKSSSVHQNRGMPPMSSASLYPNLVDNQKSSVPGMQGTPLHLLPPEDQRRGIREGYPTVNLHQLNLHRSGEFPHMSGGGGSVQHGSKPPLSGHGNENLQALSVIDPVARQQGSISTGQPRILYDDLNASKHSSRPHYPHTGEVITHTDQRYALSQHRDSISRAADRPPSQKSSQDALSGTKAGLGLQPNHSSDKSAADALDLTKLQRGSKSGGDCPLDLTVKTKKRPHVDDRETPEFDRMFLAAKRQKLASQGSSGSNSNSPRPSGVHLKGGSNADNAGNPVWISSPSPSYDHLRPPPSPAFSVSSSSSTPKTPKLPYGNVPAGDHRASSADLRLGPGEVHGGSAMGSDGGRASVDSSRAGSTGRRTPMSPHVHHLKYSPAGLGSTMNPGPSPQGKVPGLPMDAAKFVNNGTAGSTNTNNSSSLTQMVPLTTQLQKMKEEQAYQMKMLQMEPGGVPNTPHIPHQHQTPHETGKKHFKDMTDPIPAGPQVLSNEVVVVRHRQQNPYENDSKRETMQIQPGMPNPYIKHIEQQHQHSGLDKLQPPQQPQQLRQYQHHEQQQQQKIIGQHDIIELGMKDSSDPLQASRMMPASHSRGYPSQIPTNSQQMNQHHQQQMYMQQQQQQHPQQQQQQHHRQQQQRMPKNQPPQLSQLSPNTYQQQLQYQKELVLQQHHQQVKQQQQQRQQYRQQQQQQQKQQQQQFQSNQYQPEEVNHLYFKHQQEQQQRKKSVDSSQSSLSASQKWNAQIQQRKQQQVLTTSSYPNFEKTYYPNEFQRSSKSAFAGSAGYRKPGPAAPLAANPDGGKGYSRQDRIGRFGEPGAKSSLPQIAGPLPEGGVREESRRALSRRVSYPGPVEPELQRRQTAMTSLEVSGNLPVTMRSEYDPSSVTVKPRAASISGSRDSMRESKERAAPIRVEPKTSAAPPPFVDKMDDRSKSRTPSLLKDTSRPSSANLMSGDSVRTHTPLSTLSSSSPAPSASPQIQRVREASPSPIIGSRQASQSPGQFAIPLSVNIPHSSSPLTLSGSPSPAGQAPSIPSGLPPGSKAKAWSKKHMILNAVSQDESLKKIISTPSGNSNTTGGSKHEAGGISTECKSRILASSSGSGSPLPTSPKMPILSPQDGEGEESGGGQGDEQCARSQSNGNNNDGPPTLDPIKRGQANKVGNKGFTNPPSNGTISCPSTSTVFRPTSPATVSDGPLAKDNCEAVGSSSCPNMTSTNNNNNNNNQDVANHNSPAKMASSTVSGTHTEKKDGNSTPALSTPTSTDTSTSMPQDSASSHEKEDLAGNTIVVRRISLGTATPTALTPDLQQKQQLQPPTPGGLGPDELTPKGTPSFPRAEVIRRNSLTSHSLGPWGHVKNIPVANVAPFVHSPVVDEENKNKSRQQTPQQPTQNKQQPDDQQQYQMTMVQQQATASEALLLSTIKTESPGGEDGDSALSKPLPPSSDITSIEMLSGDEATVSKLEAVISEGKINKKKMKRKKKQLEEELADAIDNKDVGEALAGSSSCKKALVKTAASSNPGSPATKMLKKKGLDKLRVSSPTKMKELELLGASVEYAVLKSTTSDIEEIKALKELVDPVVTKGKTQQSAAAPVTVERIKYKHKIVRERNTRLPRTKKVSKKRAVAQIVSDEDEDDEDDDDNNGGDDEYDDDEDADDNNDGNDNDDDDEDFGGDGGKKRKSKKAKADAESKARDREERALRREQLRDQSEEGRSSRHAPSRTGGQSTRSSSRETAKTSKGSSRSSSSKSKGRTRSKDSAPSGKSKLNKPASSRISRRRLSSTKQRAQELKHNALAQRRKTGKRKIGPYNRNAAYEQELHREANRRAAVRAKRQASSRARERLQQQQRRLLRDDDDEDDEDDEEEDEAPQEAGAKGAEEEEDQEDEETEEDDAKEAAVTRKKDGKRADEDAPGSGRGAAQSARKSLQATGRKGSKDKANNSGVQGQGHGNNKTSQQGQIVAAAGPSTSHKEDYESDVEDVPDDLAEEMASAEGRRKKVGGTARSGVKAGRSKPRDPVAHESETEDGDEEESGYERSESSVTTEDLLASIPVESMPVPADLKRMTVNKNSGETLLHRAARLGHEEITLYCLRTQTVHVNASDNAGYTPLHESCVRGSVQVARHLIYYGADVNCCSQEGIRPIHDAIENDHIEVVRLLLVHGADPLIATYAGRAPVRIARSLSMLQTLQGYIGDLNGWTDGEDNDDDEDEERVEEIPWRFTSSLTFHENNQEDKYSPCIDLPGAPADDSGDVFDDGPTSAINVFHLALEGEDRTPQPFSLLDEVLNRLAIPRDKLSSLYEWKVSSVTLSSERVREVASCCCSNVSIRLPQSGEVTLLPLATLREIEAALRKQGSSAWLVGSAGVGVSGRPGSAMAGGVVKIKKEPLDGFSSSSSSSSLSASASSLSSSTTTTTSAGSGAQALFPQSSVSGKNNSSGAMGYRHFNFSSLSGSIPHSYNNNNNSGSNTSSNTSSSGNATIPVASPLVHSDKPGSVRRSDALSRVPILTKMEQQAGGFASSTANQQLFSSDLMSSGPVSFRSKQVLQPARDLFHPVSSSSTISSTPAAKSKTLSSAFSLASAGSSFSTSATATTTTTSALGGTISSSIPSSKSFFSKHTKLKTDSSFPFSTSTSSSFSSSLSLNQQKSGSYQGLPSTLHASWSSQISSSSASFSSEQQRQQQQQQQHHPSHQSLKKSGGVDHHRSTHHHQQQQQQSHQHSKQQQQQQQRSTPPSHTPSSSSSSYGKGTQPTSSKEARNSVSSGGSSSQRKTKKDDPEGSWLNAPMFSDDSSSSPFHTSIDFDSENSD